jgi:hypothetical protein
VAWQIVGAQLFAFDSFRTLSLSSLGLLIALSNYHPVCQSAAIMKLPDHVLNP